VDVLYNVCVCVCVCVCMCVYIYICIIFDLNIDINIHVDEWLWFECVFVNMYVLLVFVSPCCCVLDLSAALGVPAGSLLAALALLLMLLLSTRGTGVVVFGLACFTAGFSLLYLLYRCCCCCLWFSFTCCTRLTSVVFSSMSTVLTYADVCLLC
jgi:hypothetical protein